MKHIDIDAIRNDPKARLEFLAEFCLMTDDDWVALDDSLPHLAPRLPELLDRLYDHLLDYDDTRRIFLGQRGEIDTSYMELRKEHMTEWVMRTISVGDRDQFVAYLVRTAQRHTGIASEPGRAVPPRYMVALISFIQTAILNALFDALPEEHAARRRLSLAWNKMLMIQLELFLKYVAPQWPQWDETE